MTETIKAIRRLVEENIDNCTLEIHEETDVYLFIFSFHISLALFTVQYSISKDIVQAVDNPRLIYNEMIEKVEHTLFNAITGA